MLRPQQPGERLPLDHASLRRSRSADGPCRRTRRLPSSARATIASTSFSGSVICSWVKRSGRTSDAARGHVQLVSEAGLRALLRRIHRIVLAIDDVPMEGVLHVLRTAYRAGAEHARRVRFVVGEQRLAARRAVEIALAQLPQDRQVLQRLAGSCRRRRWL